VIQKIARHPRSPELAWEDFVRLYGPTVSAEEFRRMYWERQHWLATQEKRA
jgi:hypothetical protein